MMPDEKQWTRLIDGELSFGEQRALLATLDATPNGWKRLALGLLEAEAFRRELRHCAPPAASAVSSPPTPATRIFHRRRQVAMASLVGLICLGLGMGIEHYRQPGTDFTGQTTAAATTARPAEVRRQQTLNLVFADGPAGAQSVEVPVIDAEGAAAEKLLQLSAVPDEWRQNLEAQGYVIHEERKYVPVSLANGRQGIAPISDVVVEYQPVAFQ